MSSCKEKSVSKNKHYTLMERKVFLQILEKYKNIAEKKKSDATTLKDKDVAWTEICEEYNQSVLICQERTVQQLKKLWANLKQAQRDALTKEKQACLATGGGPLEVEANIDPDILNIAPHLTETAPVLFTSNMTETEMEDKREFTFNIISNDNLDILDDANKENWRNDNDIRIVDSQDTLTDTPILRKYNKQVPGTTSVQSKKRKHINQELLSDTEENLRAQRIKQVMTQEQELAVAKLKYEENTSKLKEDHLKEINKMEIQHKKTMNNLEIKIGETKLQILENEYLKKENINLRL